MSEQTAILRSEKNIPIKVLAQQDVKEEQPTIKKKRGKRRAIGIIVIALASLLTGAYFFFSYSSFQPVSKLRTIYIETALTTMDHQWLATAFLPKSAVAKVQQQIQEEVEKQKAIQSKWKEQNQNLAAEAAKPTFRDIYWELSDATYAYVSTNYDFETAYINNLDESLDLKTVFDEKVLVLDVPNNLLILKVTGPGYVGKLAVVKDSTQIDLAIASNIGSHGQFISEMADGNNAILAMNASGFVDYDGRGNGGTPVGMVLKDGHIYGKVESSYQVIGMYQSKFMISSFGIAQTYDWAIQWHPTLILNGETLVDGTFGMGLQPRAALGQTEDGDFLMLVIDGRQVGYSVGATIQDSADIMKKHKAYQATNIDGGSSAIMYYDGELITKTSSPAKTTGRYLPDAIIVHAAD